MNESLFTPKMSTNPNGFHFQRPEYVEGLSHKANLAMAMGAMASRLVSEERTRTIHPDGRRENVAEHSLMLVKVAVQLARAMYPHLDAGIVAIKAADHDDVESYVRDTPTDRISEQGRDEKAQRETRGSHQLALEYGEIAPGYVRDHAEYEAQNDPHSRFVRVVDKIMVVLIHIPNKGKTLRENYTYEDFVAKTHETAARLFGEYPEYNELIDLRTEIAMYLADQYLVDCHVTI